MNAIAENFDGGEINSPDYWNKRFFEDWIAKGGRKQTAFFAKLSCRELPGWFVDEARTRKSSIFDYGCALGDALPVLQRAFPDSRVRGGDVAQVGLGLARALHPGFEFVDVNAIGKASKVADIVYCSNTLEHFENWREILDRLSRHAKEYVVVVVPFEEEDRIDEHAAMFEFDSLPPLLPSGTRLLHLGVFNAGLEPDTQWNGLQLIAVYGKKRRGSDPGSAGLIAQQRNEAMVLDLRGIELSSIPSLLASLRAMSHAKRRLARELGERRELEQTAAANAQAAARSELARTIDEVKRAHAADLDAHRLRAAEQVAALQASLTGVVREYHDLTRGVETAQSWLLDSLTALDPDLISNRQITPVSDDWAADLTDAAVAHRATLAHLIEAVHRANRLGMVFHERATSWRAERGALIRQLDETQREAQRASEDARRSLQETTRVLEEARHASEEARGSSENARQEAQRASEQARRALENAIGQRDRARGRALALEANAANCSPAAASIATGRAAPLVSIILPVYNQAYLVDEAIAGILSQTYENWELIVLDDGSADDLECRLRHHVGDRRMIFLRQPNQKLPAALNHAFGYARGELLTWTSADNIMLPTQLERFVEELAAHPDAGLVYSDYWAIDDKGEPLDDCNWRAHNRDPEIPDLIRLPSEATIENFHLSGDNFIGASFLYRRTVAEIVGRYADDTFGGEDYDFWLRMHLVTGFRHVAEPLYKYRVHRDTLTSRAAELGLFANIRELLEADRWRTENLLVDGVLRTGEAALRPLGQFHSSLVKRCRPFSYRGFVERSLAAATAGPAVTDLALVNESAIVDPVIVDIDVPARLIDRAVLRDADILLCRSELSAALLRREEWAQDKRILVWNGEPTDAVQHAFIQAFADQVTASMISRAAPTPPKIDDPFLPTRILLLVDRWASGGLENIVIDLALSLAGKGRIVFVASAREAPPPASAFAGGRVRTMSFRGDEEAFENFLRSAAIEVVNYHHSNFAAARANERAVATVYTMHNCYLWMDDGAREQVRGGLARMDRVIAVSRQVAQFAVAQFSVACERIAVVPNGLSDDIMNRASAPAGRRMWNRGTDRFTVAMVASLTRPKLHHVAIAAFAEAAQDTPDMRLRLIGAPLDQPYHQELQARIAASSHGNLIELVAGLTRAEAIGALAEAQVFLLPSLVEGCSMALLEAAAAGCVCIASDVGAARDLDVAGGSVVLVPSPLGELDRVTQRQFLDAAAADLPEHRANVAEALRTVWRDYGSFAAGVAETRTRLRQLSSMDQMTDAYLLAYTLAWRGGPRRGGGMPRGTPEAQAALLAETVGAG